MAATTDLIDSHCHLDAPEFEPDRDAVVRLARIAGVNTIVVPAIAVSNFAATRTMAGRYPGCVCAFGLHPIYIDTHQPQHLQALRKELQQGGAVAVGEIGLDGFVPGLDMARQEWLFAEQLKIAAEFDLPVLLHIRRAQDPILKHLRRIRVRGGIAHAFNGSRQQADEFIRLGFKLGFGGAMTFDRALRIRQLARDLPLQAMVLETDAPDIAPSWIYRQRNTPAEVANIAAVLAELRQMPLAEAAAATSANVRQLLRLPPPARLLE